MVQLTHCHDPPSCTKKHTIVSGRRKAGRRKVARNLVLRMLEAVTCDGCGKTFSKVAKLRRHAAESRCTPPSQTRLRELEARVREASKLVRKEAAQPLATATLAAVAACEKRPLQPE